MEVHHTMLARSKAIIRDPQDIQVKPALIHYVARCGLSSAEYRHPLPGLKPKWINSAEAGRKREREGENERGRERGRDRPNRVEGF